MNSVIKSVCVYCGSRTGDEPSHATVAKEIGTILAKNNFKIVFGAGSIGMMGIVARSAIAAGGDVIGVIPEHLNDIEITQPGLTEIHITPNMHERKSIMFNKSDAFVLLPGGLGSMDEFFEILTWSQLDLHSNPIIILNHKDYWRPLLNLIDHIIEEDFAAVKCRSLFQVVDTVEGVIEILKTSECDITSAKPELF